MKIHYSGDQPQARRRYAATLGFIERTWLPPATILTLGPENPLAEEMRGRGYIVENTPAGVDLDLEPEIVRRVFADAVTAFEILEHLVAPFNVLRELPGRRLFATVPLRLWFAPAYRNPADEWDRHFHEFEDRQFDWLLQKAGWMIERRQKLTNPGPINGIQPLLRRFIPRHYAIEAVRRS